MKRKIRPMDKSTTLNKDFTYKYFNVVIIIGDVMSIFGNDEEENKDKGFARGVEREKESENNGFLGGILNAAERAVEDTIDDAIMPKEYNEGKKAGEEYIRRHR